MQTRFDRISAGGSNVVSIKNPDYLFLQEFTVKVLIGKVCVTKSVLGNCGLFSNLSYEKPKYHPLSSQVKRNSSRPHTLICGVNIIMRGANYHSPQPQTQRPLVLRIASLSRLEPPGTFSFSIRQVFLSEIFFPVDYLGPLSVIFHIFVSRFLKLQN